MRSIALLLRKDVRLQRLTLACWLAVLAAEVVLALCGLDARPVGRTEAWNAGATTLTFAHLALAFVLLAGAVQADAPVSSTAFWVTRPLGRWHVLGSKLVFALVVVALPWLVANVVILLARGIAAGDVVRGLPNLILVQAVVALPVIVLAALTANLARAVVALVGLIALMLGVSYLLFFGGLVELTERSFEPGRGPAADAMGGLVVLAMAAAGTALAYRRRPRQATALVVVAVPLALGTLQLWPWSFDRTRRAPLPPTVALTAGDTRRTGTALVRSTASSSWSKRPVVGEALVSGVPDDLHAVPTRVDTSLLRQQDGSRQEFVIEPRAADATPDAPASIVVAGLGRVAALSASRTAWLATTRNETIERRTATILAVTARVHLALLRERLVARLPLRTGSRWDAPSQRIVLVSAALDDAVALELVDSGPLRGEVRPEGTESLPSVAGWPPLVGSYYALYNAATRELLRFRTAWSAPMAIPAAAGGLRIDRQRLELAWPHGDRWRDREQRAAFLRGAEVVKIDTDVVAEGERALQVNDLSLPPKD